MVVQPCAFAAPASVSNTITAHESRNECGMVIFMLKCVHFVPSNHGEDQRFTEWQRSLDRRVLQKPPPPALPTRSNLPASDTVSAGQSIPRCQSSQPSPAI